MERPQWSAVLSMLDDVRRTAENVGEVQKKMLQVTGTAWSEDRMVKAVVGPRGHLIELDIDPRVFRKPNSKALAQSIVATVRAAVDQTMQQTQKILEESMPRDLPTDSVGGLNIRKLMGTHDADLTKEDDSDV